MRQSIPDKERKDIFQANRTRGRARANIGNIEDFLTLVRVTMKTDEVAKEFPALRDIELMQAVPHITPKDPAIYYKIMSQWCGSVDSKEHSPLSGVSSHRTYERLPRIRQTNMKDPRNPGYSAQVLGWWIDARVAFSIVSSQGSGTNLVSREFNEFMFGYMGYFREWGIARVMWSSEIETPEELNRWQEDLIIRTHKYFVRYEKQYMRRDRNLSFLNIQVIFNK